MKILITNDDGIESEGIIALAKEFEVDNEVVIVAPNTQRSAAGHSITINRPIVVKEVKINGINSKAYSIDGTPADCVKIGIEKIYKDKFDCILSGVNFGTNLGSDVIYSGTVSAAIEGSIYKIPSIAISMEINGARMDYKLATQFTRKVVSLAFANNIENDIVLNVNIPSIPLEEIKGIKVSELGNRNYTNCYIETLMEDNSIGYKIEGSPIDDETIDTDVYNFKKGFITVTPLHYDLTNYKILKDVDAWFKGDNSESVKQNQLSDYLIAKKDFNEYQEMYKVVDFLNKNLKSEGIIFGLTKNNESNTISIYKIGKV